jgi:hypothetical protein
MSILSRGVDAPHDVRAPMKFSIVIATYNRAPELAATPGVAAEPRRTAMGGDCTA